MKKLVGVLVLLAVLVGCDAEDTFSKMLTAKADTGDYLIQRYNGVYTFVDPATGVNYLIYDWDYGGGMCPRYNADGSLMISELK